MDHVPLPSAPIAPRPQVPLVCTPDLSCHFLEFPIKHSQPDYLNDHPEAIPDEHDEAFIQAWLFFSLLNTFFGSIDPAGYIDGDVVHTRSLTEALSAFTSKQHNVEELHRCLKQAQLVITAAARSTDLDSPLWMSVMALLETLGTGLNKTYTIHYYKLSDSRRSRLLQHGWCPFEIRTIFAEVDAFSHSYYLQNLDKGAETHPDCTEYICHKAAVTTAYRSKHICGGTCESLGLTYDQIATCLDNDTQPLIDIVDDSISLAQGPYIALSHVWVDGLGNPEDNSLPRCQLRRIGGYLRAMERKIKEVGDPEVHLLLWLDTICCPVDPTYKQKSLAMMASVYRNSHFTLVMDSDIERYRYNDPVEAMVRVFTSKWAHRLWTLQEAALPDRLMISFKGIAMDFVMMLMNIQQYKSPLVDWLNQEYFATRIWFTPDSTDGETVSRQQGIDLFAKRRLSRTSDEAICLSSFLSIAPQLSMDAVWTTLAQSGDLSSSIIFNKLPRSSLGWAPSTILAANADFGSNLTGEHKAQLTEHGLLVEGQRLILQGTESFKLSEASLRKYRNQGNDEIELLRDTDGQWFAMVDGFSSTEGSFLPDMPGTLHDRMGATTKELLSDHSRDWNLLFDINQQTGQKHALLTEQIGLVNGIPRLKSVALIKLVELSKYKTWILQTSWWYAQAFGQTWLPRCLRSLYKVETIALHLASMIDVRVQWSILQTVRAIIESHFVQCMVWMAHVALNNDDVSEKDGRTQVVTFLSLACIGQYTGVQKETSQDAQCFVC